MADTYVNGGFVAPDSPYLAQLLDVTARWHEADLLVARSATRGVVGTVTFCLGGSRWANIARAGEAEFRMLAVDPLVQGRGVGGLLVCACLARAAAAGVTTTVISTEPEMVVAQRMYERMGFVRSPERDWAPRPGIDLLTYRYEAAGTG
ncbi:MAG: GNAT family N-acetyltransferase [Jiangellales bacterium]